MQQCRGALHNRQTTHNPRHQLVVACPEPHMLPKRRAAHGLKRDIVGRRPTPRAISDSRGTPGSAQHVLPRYPSGGKHHHFCMVSLANFIGGACIKGVGKTADAFGALITRHTCPTMDLLHIAFCDDNRPALQRCWPNGRTAFRAPQQEATIIGLSFLAYLREPMQGNRCQSARPVHDITTRGMLEHAEPCKKGHAKPRSPPATARPKSMWM